MIAVGIEAMNICGGTASVDVKELAVHRKLNQKRFDNLLMQEKTVAMPYEDPITFAVNAAKPIVDSLLPEGKDRIELLITCTESGIDFGKSISTYVHDYLDLNKNCRMFELKQACYSGTAGFQMAINFILSQVSPGAKALIIASDISRFISVEGGDAMSDDWSYAEPSSGAGAVALLVSDSPHIFKIDVGANGCYGYEVMDTCRPVPDSEAGNAELSLASYLDCCENKFLEYKKRVPEVDYRDSFQYLTFHTPFGGMVEGAHRHMMRKLYKEKLPTIKSDFERRVMPGLKYCQRVGNIMGATVFLSLASTIDKGNFKSPQRVGCYSYGSGCCSEFYSGIVTPYAQHVLRECSIEGQLNGRHSLTMEEYDMTLESNNIVKFGTRNARLNINTFSGFNVDNGEGERLVLHEIREFHRKYEWA